MCVWRKLLPVKSLTGFFYKSEKLSVACQCLSTNWRYPLLRLCSLVLDYTDPLLSVNGKRYKSEVCRVTLILQTSPKTFSNKLL